MFAFARRLFHRRPPKWGGTYYVSAFQAQIDGIAKELSVKRKIYTRFNGDLGCVEMYHDWRTTVAQIRVHGECCSPTHAIVTSNFSDDAKALFIKVFPFPVEFQVLA